MFLKILAQIRCVGFHFFANPLFRLKLALSEIIHMWPKSERECLDIALKILKKTLIFMVQMRSQFCESELFSSEISSYDRILKSTPNPSPPLSASSAAPAPWTVALWQRAPAIIRKQITDCQIPAWSPFVPGGVAIGFLA